MRWFRYNELGPGDTPITVTISEAEILSSYFPYWSGQMRARGKADQISEAACIDDWVVVNWAWEVPPPPVTPAR